MRGSGRLRLLLAFVRVVAFCFQAPSTRCRLCFALSGGRFCFVSFPVRLRLQDKVSGVKIGYDFIDASNTFFVVQERRQPPGCSTAAARLPAPWIDRFPCTSLGTMRPLQSGRLGSCRI